MSIARASTQSNDSSRHSAFGRDARVRTLDLTVISVITGVRVRRRRTVAVGEKDEILRFRESERQLHWALAVPFMVSWTTAVVLVSVYNPHPERPYRLIFSWVHRTSGLWLSVLPLWTIVTHRHDFRVYLNNMKEAWRWRFDDLKWLALMGPAALNSKIALPDQGKFNAAEKINFMSLTTTYPLYIVTGVLIWLPGVALFAWLLHFSLALMATPLILGHIFMATVNPDTRVGLTGMITGFVPREWARHHYHRWYVELFETGTETVVPELAAADILPEPVVVAERPAPAVLAERPAPVVVAERPAPVVVAERPAPVVVANRPAHAAPAEAMLTVQ
jgi:formate dehydrogenase gamma subunit